MAQQTNLNVSPYYDDFNANNDYYKVLFKPGIPVQSRELTTLQSILQNQIEKFGQHVFKDGSKVIPGNTTYNSFYYAVELQNTYQGIPVSAYADQLIGSKIIGQTSGVTAVVDNVLMPEDSERESLTLYVNYIDSNTQNTANAFSDGELLSSSVTLFSGLLSNATIPSGSPFAITKATNSTSIGSAFSISNGVYFIRGYFVNVNDETLILDQYDNKPSYRVGLYINEEIITSDMDESLNDNSQGFNNYAAPGADRFKISVSLLKKSLDDFNDNNFVELATISNGVLRSQKTTPEYNILNDVLARRTYAESGDYYVTPFDVAVKESLNDNIGNQGIFNSNQLTYNGSTPSDNLAIYQVSPGRAFVRGYDIETVSPTFLDSPKPRTTATLTQQALNYTTGPTFKVNRVFGSPKVGIGNTYVLSLRDSRVGTSGIVASGKEIGLARVYDFRLESGSYDTSNGNLNQWDISLYDIQTTTEITLNVPVSLTVPTLIKGKYSGASAFLKDSVVNSNSITVYNKTGEFLNSESFIIDGIESGIVATAVTSYGISDIKSVYGYIGSGTTFTADIIQSNNYSVGIVTISASSAGISTVYSVLNQFSSNVFYPGDIVRYTSTYNDPVYAKISNVNKNSLEISSVTTVPGITSSILPSSSITVSDFTLLKTNLNSSTDNTLYTELPKENISNVDLSTSSLTIRKTFDVNIQNNQLSVPITAGPNENFLPFTPDRYLLTRSDGSTEVLTSDKFNYISGSTQLQIYNLGSNDTGATLVTTLTKLKPKEKVKIKNRVNSLIVSKSKYSSSGIGTTTLNDGLSFGNYPYGTRVQDEIISLNVPDIIEIHGIYEALDSTISPSAPTAILASISGPSNTTGDYIIGEKIVGQTSGAIAICAEILSNNKISFIYKNQNQFKEGETIISQESNIQAIVTTLDISAQDISPNYTFATGQESTIYNYGTIQRNSSFSEPSKSLKIYFTSTYYSPTDDGDITTINSYNTFDYGKEIKTVNQIRNSDILDIRPRVSQYNVSENSRSPLEFYGRTFNSSGNSAANILASNEDIIASFSYYLGRIDTIYLTKDGIFQIKYGTPSEKYEKPVIVDGALEIATVTLPPYLYNVSQASLEFMSHKGYKMSDIKKLEDRIKNLEYYTTLSLLETNTANLFVPDSSGLNRFKSGFFVDNFSSFISQESNLEYKNSIDLNNKELRPSHYTTSLDLTCIPFTNIDPTSDNNYTQPDGINVKKSNGVITLDYSEVEWLKQSFATRTVSVTPFMVNYWKGVLDLTPSSDTWMETSRLEPKIINVEGNYANDLINSINSAPLDTQSGLSPSLWNGWSLNWTGTEVNTIKNKTTIVKKKKHKNKTKTLVYENTVVQTLRTGTATRTVTKPAITEQYDTKTVGTRIVSRNLISFMRSRNIEFNAQNLKPSTQVYAFFDGIDVTQYCIPKLLEISMISGVFQVGETVIGTTEVTGLNPLGSVQYPNIKFRVANSNHFSGPYNNPTKTYSYNPYTKQALQASYSSTSNILNVDTYSLSNQPQGQYGGWVSSGMILIGATSGAQAKITNVRLISGSYGIIGSFYIPDSNFSSNPKFETGTKLFTLIDSASNDTQNSNTSAESKFVASGILETVQDDIISVRTVKVENKQETETIPISEVVGVSTISSTLVPRVRRPKRIDPIAQSFTIDVDSGIFVTGCDIFFSDKDDMDIPVIMQIRSMVNGYPSEKVVPLSEISLDPSQILLSNDGTIATRFQFNAPVYLEGGKDYAVCLLSNSTKYSVFVSRVGETDFTTKQLISTQPYLGSLFKSQNASTWEPSQWEDLKFTLYRANFVTSGTVNFYSPDLNLGNGQIAKLLPNSLNLTSRKIRIGIGTTLQDSDLTLGNTIIQMNSTGSGNYVGNAGIATGRLTVINTGIGYTPSSGGFTFNNVSLNAVTGSGRNATANITVSNGSVVSTGVTIVNGGIGYQVGDVLEISSIGNVNVGQNARFTVGVLTAINELILDNVQGDFTTGTGSTVQFINSSGITTTLNSTVGGNVTVNSPIVIISDGLHINVNHKNHGMYSSENYVTLSNVESDIKPTKLSVDYNASSTTAISVDDISNFTKFEGYSVSVSNPGYVKIGDEVISYTAINGSTLSGVVQRGDNPKNYPAGTPVYKYELNGVSLNRINTTHNFADVTNSDPYTFDSYQIKLDMSNNGVDRSVDTILPKLYMNNTKSSGGYSITATQNIPFEVITPNVHNVTIRGTSLASEIQTITGSSISGNEIPFVTNEFESITLNESNYLQSSRLICSRINETNHLSSETRSLTMKLTLSTTDSNISPVIDSDRVNAIFTTNRVNKVIQDYATDNRVNTLTEDPTAFQYISKEISLENAATSIKIIVSSHINKYCDIRAFYAIGSSQNFTPIFSPFPGYNNLDSRQQIINFANSDGRSDTYVPESSVLAFDSSEVEFKDYTFTADNLPSFRSYRIKLVMTSTNQVYVPRLKDLRVIALA